MRLFFLSCDLFLEHEHSHDIVHYAVRSDLLAVLCHLPYDSLTVILAEYHNIIVAAFGSSLIGHLIFKDVIFPLAVFEICVNGFTVIFACQFHFGIEIVGGMSYAEYSHKSDHKIYHQYYHCDLKQSL